MTTNPFPPPLDRVVDDFCAQCDALGYQDPTIDVDVPASSVSAQGRLIGPVEVIAEVSLPDGGRRSRWLVSPSMSDGELADHTRHAVERLAKSPVVELTPEDEGEAPNQPG